MFFPEFRLIQSNFQSIEILFKKFSEPLPGSIDRTYFSINRTSCFKFFKTSALIDSKMCFWKIWVEYKCFWKTFHLILLHSIHKILCFEEFLHKIALFFKKKKLCFPNFRSIKTVSWLIENAIKILVWIWPFQSLLDCF